MTDDPHLTDSFTYVPSERSDIRIVTITAMRDEIGDSIKGMGILPNGKNMSDDQLIAFYEREGNHAMRGSARALESVATIYARLPKTTLSPHSQDFSSVQKMLKAHAERLRKQYGYGDPDYEPVSKRAHRPRSRAVRTTIIPDIQPTP